MSTRFEVFKNGERVCISGIDGDGVLSVLLSYVRRRDAEPQHDLQISGLGMFDRSRDQQCHAFWRPPEVVVGDEITIRILPPGEFNEPHGIDNNPSKMIDDPEFGQMNYSNKSWDADISFDCHPIQSAHIHLRADESGPKQQQRNLILELRRRHAELWPDICAAITRCHVAINDPDELVSRINPRISIDLGADEDGDPDAINITYGVEGDPEFRQYNITLRGWEIVEVYKSD